MKILLTLDFPPQRGGIQTYLKDIVKYRYESDDIVLVGCAYTPPPAKPGSYSARIRFVSNFASGVNKKLSLPSLLRVYMRCIRRHRHAQPVTECGNIYAALIPFICSFFMPVSYRVYTYGTELLHAGRWGIYPALLRRAMQRASLIYVLGSYTESLIFRLGIDTATRHVPPRLDIPPAVLTKRRDLDPGRIQSESMAFDPYIILCLGRLVKVKGQNILIRACELCRFDIPWRLILAGEGPLEKPLRERIEKSGFRERITLETSVDEQEKEELYRQAHVCVVPSIETSHETEGFGITALEAMAHGRAVIASNAGGLPDAVGECGLVFPAGNSEECAAHLQRLYHDSELYTRLVKCGYERVLNRFLWSTAA